MLNIEKYKDEILNAAQSDITCCVIDLFHNGVCPDNCKDCKREAMEWLLSEYKEPILDEVEREYLAAVIRPFRNKIVTISKFKSWDDNSQYIHIETKDNYFATLPVFPKDTMYKGMKGGRHYSLKELGL
mgnify:CR=1 FL=1